MQDEAQGLNEVVVTAFGIQRKKIFTYAAQQVDGDDVNKTKVVISLLVCIKVKSQVYKLSREMPLVVL
jgi:hypothetical protein